MESIAKLIERATDEEAKKAEEARFKAMISDMVGSYNSRIPEIIDSLETKFISNGKAIKDGKIRPYLFIDVNPYTVQEVPEYSIVTEKCSNPGFCMELEIRHPEYPNSEIMLNNREVKAIGMTIAEKLLPEIRKGNPNARYNEDYGRIEFGYSNV